MLMILSSVVLAHRLRQHRQPHAGARHYPPCGNGRAHGSRRRTAAASSARCSPKACSSVASAGLPAWALPTPGRAPFSLSHFPMRPTCPSTPTRRCLCSALHFWSRSSPASCLALAPRGSRPMRSPPKCCAASTAPRATALRCRRKLWSSFRPRCPLVLLAGAILMTKSLNNLEHQNFGVATSNRYVLHFDPAGAGYTIDRLPALYRQIEDRFSALPGVTSVGMALYSPLEGDNWGECVIQQGHPAPRPGDKCGSTWDRVSTHFLDSIGVPMVRGRGFSRTGHGHIAAGRHRQSDFRQALLPQSGSHRPALRHRRRRSTPAAWRSSASSPTSR